MERFLVTGASGSLGSHIVNQLVAEGAEVRALALPGDRLAERLPQSVRLIRGDVCSQDDIDRFIDGEYGGESTVIHAAGIVAILSGRSERVYNTNVIGTRNVVDACVARGVKKLVYISSVHAIEPLERGRRMSEPAGFAPERISGFYGKTKAEAAQIVSGAHSKNGLNTSIVFPSGLIGPGDNGIGHMTRLLIEYISGRLPAGVSGAYDFADVRDVAAGVIAAARLGGAGQNYILGNRVITIKEILAAARKCCGCKEVRLYLPLWLARLGAPFCEAYYRIRGIKPLFTGYSLEVLGSNADFSSEKAKAELGYASRPIEETIADTVKWLKEEGLA